MVLVVLQLAQVVPSLLAEDCNAGRGTMLRQIVACQKAFIRVNNSHQSPLWLDERPVLSVHLVVESTRIAQVVAIAISPPEGGGGGPTVHALSPFYKKKKIIVVLGNASET